MACNSHAGQRGWRTADAEIKMLSELSRNEYLAAVSFFHVGGVSFAAACTKMRMAHAVRWRLGDVNEETVADEETTTDEDNDEDDEMMVCKCEAQRRALESTNQAMMFARVVTTELTAAAAVAWWGDSEGEVVVVKDVRRFGD